MLKLLIAVFGMAIVALVAATAGLAPARAQGLPAAPTGLTVADGADPGTVAVSWDAADVAAFYRIGWVAAADIAAVRDAGRPWEDAFVFADVSNYGQDAYTISGLVAGAEYGFIIGSLDARYGAAQWSEWARLTLAEAPGTSCPTAPPTPTPSPTTTPPVTPTPSPTSAPMPTPSPAPTRVPMPTPTPAPHPTPAATGDYDADDDGLIEVSSLAQLAAIRADLNGDGVSPAPFYAATFPDAMPGMGCPDAGCTGYELVVDLDFDTNGNGETDAGDAYWNDGAGWIPIGDRAHKFTADFDGNNHTIANLYIDRGDADYVGLFGYARRSSIKQVGLASATVSGDDYIGGLVGYSHYSAISDSYTTGRVSGDDYVGGLVGYSYLNSAITASYATSTVSGDSYVGGLIGFITWSANVRGSYAKGSVSGGDYVGGLVGDGNYSIIVASYATGSVAGGPYVGGLVGDKTGGAIIDSYATSSVSGSGDDIGGLVGRNEGDITTSYAVGHVSTSGDTFYIGGLIGYHEGGDIIASYWDTQTTGQAGSYGGVGKTTSELQSPVGYTGIYAEWNRDWDGDGNGDDLWDFGDSAQYPVLKYGGLDVAAQRQ